MKLVPEPEFTWMLRQDLAALGVETDVSVVPWLAARVTSYGLDLELVPWNELRRARTWTGLTRESAALQELRRLVPDLNVVLREMVAAQAVKMGITGMFAFRRIQFLPHRNAIIHVSADERAEMEWHRARSYWLYLGNLGCLPFRPRALPGDRQEQSGTEDEDTAAQGTSPTPSPASTPPASPKRKGGSTRRKGGANPSGTAASSETLRSPTKHNGGNDADSDADIRQVSKALEQQRLDRRQSQQEEEAEENQAGNGHRKSGRKGEKEEKGEKEKEGKRKKASQPVPEATDIFAEAYRLLEDPPPDDGKEEGPK